MAPDIEKVVEILRKGEVWSNVEPFIEEFESVTLQDFWISSPTTTTLQRVVGTSGPKKRRASIAAANLMRQK